MNFYPRDVVEAKTNTTLEALQKEGCQSVTPRGPAGKPYRGLAFPIPEETGLSPWQLVYYGKTSSGMRERTQAFEDTMTEHQGVKGLDVLNRFQKKRPFLNDWANVNECARRIKLTDEQRGQERMDAERLAEEARVANEQAVRLAAIPEEPDEEAADEEEELVGQGDVGAVGHGGPGPMVLEILDEGDDWKDDRTKNRGGMFGRKKARILSSVHTSTVSLSVSCSAYLSACLPIILVL